MSMLSAIGGFEVAFTIFKYMSEAKRKIRYDIIMIYDEL